MGVHEGQGGGILKINKGKKGHRDIKEDRYRRRERGASKKIDTEEGKEGHQRR